MNMIDFLAFFQVILVDIVLSGDNAVVIGALAASLPLVQRNKAILYGMTAAVVIRILLSLGVVYVLKIPGIMAIGGFLLLYVAWNMWKDLKDDGELNDSTETKQAKTFAGALVAIALADFSMSLDNVLGVAGAAEGHTLALAFGLVLSIGLMGVAAKVVSGLIDKYKWISYVGLSLIVFIAAKMFYHGVPDAIASIKTFI